MILRSASRADRDRNAIRSAGLDESFWKFIRAYPAKSFPIMPSSLLFLILFLFLSRFSSYIEGNVEFKCGDGNWRLGCLVESFES